MECEDKRRDRSLERQKVWRFMTILVTINLYFGGDLSVVPCRIPDGKYNIFRDI